MADFKKVPRTRRKNISPELLALCLSITAKRARTVINHILKHGIITNEDLSNIYSYDHPPRAIRDVREVGIPLITHKITSEKTGRKIGAYTFDKLANVKRGRVGGRRAFPKRFKLDLVRAYGARDAITGEPLDPAHLQIDHRVPYQVTGDGGDLDVREFMLIDAASQRMKSWSCEHCKNWLDIQDIAICRTCFWAAPEAYSHIAMEAKRRIDIVWSGTEVADFERVKAASDTKGLSISDYVKRILKK
jgi:hypothetical protein